MPAARGHGRETHHSRSEGSAPPPLLQHAHTRPDRRTVLYPRWIETSTAAVTEQLRTQNNLAELRDPGQWADRAAYHWAAILHAICEGNGRTVRLFLEDLADQVGHTLDWTRSSHDRNNTAAIAAAHGDYEPARALLTIVAGGTTGIDRPVAVLNDLDKYLHAQAWARTGLVFGTEQEKQTVTDQLRELDSRVGDVTHHLRSQDPTRADTREQPATDRWRGVVDSIHPSLTRDPQWPSFAAELDASAAPGIDVAAELPRRARPDPTRAAPAPGREPAADGAPPAAYPTGYVPDPAAPPAAAPSTPSPLPAPAVRSGPRR